MGADKGKVDLHQLAADYLRARDSLKELVDLDREITDFDELERYNDRLRLAFAAVKAAWAPLLAAVEEGSERKGAGVGTLDLLRKFSGEN